MVTLWITAGAMAACAAAEWLHGRRTARIARLAFGPAGRARAWTPAAPALRCAGVGALCWGLLTLLSLEGGATARGNDRAETIRHLLICLDVSPSMYLKDAGPDAAATRGDRAAEVLRSLFDRLDMTRTRVSIVAFYTTAKPVVVETDDLNVVTNILEDLPLEQAFKGGPTAMYEGVREAAALAQRWPPGSATLVVVSDGDTLPDAAAPSVPRSVADVLVLGVGNPHRGSQIAGHSSRQDAASLKRLAARLNGVYHDGNAKHLPSNVLAGLAMLDSGPRDPPTLRTLALIAVGVGGILTAGIIPALALAGVPAPVAAAERSLRARARRRATEQTGGATPTMEPERAALATLTYGERP